MRRTSNLIEVNASGRDRPNRILEFQAPRVVVSNRIECALNWLGGRPQWARGASRWRIRGLMPALMAVAMLAFSLNAQARPQSEPPLSQFPGCLEARQGLDVLMNGDPDGATGIFQTIVRENPNSPLGYLLEADATWWKIYYTTAKLTDPSIFNVLYENSSPYDSHFNDLVNAAIRKSVMQIHAGREVGRDELYEGMAYALRGRFESLRNNNLATARASKRMRAHLLAALQRDPSLTDAYAGIGLYNYFVDTLPGIVKVLRFLIALPGGNRALGLQQLETVARDGDLARGEAEFYLAKDYSRWNEKQYAKSLELFQQLAQQYPQNPLWPLLMGSLEVRLGHQNEGRKDYGEVFARTAGQHSDVAKALHLEAERAIGGLGGAN